MNKEVASPCNSICTIDAKARICVGCGRTLDEIAAWGTADPDRRRAILAELDGRKRALEASRRKDS